MGFFRPEDWSGFPFPLPGDLPDPGIECASPVSPAFAVRFFTTEPPGKPLLIASGYHTGEHGFRGQSLTILCWLPLYHNANQL